MCPGRRTLFESIVAELSQYLKLPLECFAGACASGDKSVTEDSSTRRLHKGSEPNEIVEFYEPHKATSSTSPSSILNIHTLRHSTLLSI